MIVFVFEKTWLAKSTVLSSARDTTNSETETRSKFFQHKLSIQALSILTLMEDWLVQLPLYLLDFVDRLSLHAWWVFFGPVNTYVIGIGFLLRRRRDPQFEWHHGVPAYIGFSTIKLQLLVLACVFSSMEAPNSSFEGTCRKKKY